MKTMPLPQHGACRCGAARLRIQAPPLLTAVCHCTGCQRMSGSAFSVTVAVPSEGFETEGELREVGVPGGPTHMGCAACGSWMFTRPDMTDAFVNVRATLLDDTEWFEPFLQTYTSEKLPWVSVPTVHSFEAFPPAEAYGDLLDAFSAQYGS